ncbi:MAG: 5'-3' exonuclease H3TH domain-containing protein, partial [Planctomycetota bacterium]
MAERFFIIDGLSQIFRSYYAPFQALSSPSGEPTRATYVFTNMLLQLIREQKPDYLAMAMDSAEEVFRLEVDPEYKANREPPPEDLAPQIDRILEIVESQGIPILSVPGFEADDVIATLCNLLAGKDVEIFLVGTDKDLHQLLSDRVRMFDPSKDAVMGPAELRAKKGYGPDQAVEIQTLSGDATDNIPGVKGVGPKKAAALIEKYGSAAAVIEHAGELTPAMSKNVQAFAEKLEITRQLVTLRQDVPLDFDFRACKFTQVDKSALQPIVAELGFRRLLEQMSDETAEAGEVKSVEKTARDYILVDNQEKFEDFLSQFKKQSVFAFDTETTSLNPVWAGLCGMSFSWQAGEGYYLPFAGVGVCLDMESALEALRPIMADAGIKKVGQNIKYDLVVLAHHGVPVAGVEFDTMIASFVLDSSRRSHGLDTLARDLLGIVTIPISDLIGKGKNQLTFDAVDTARAGEYATEDADVTWQLYELFREQLTGSDLEALFHETEMPLVE